MNKLHDSNRDRQSPDAKRLDVLGIAIVQALHNTQSGRSRIENGRASLSALPKPVTTPYGTSTQVYRYEDGCRPVAELNKGVQVIYFKAENEKTGDELTFSVGKVYLGKSLEASSDMYQFTGNRTTGGESVKVAQLIVPEAEITAPLVLVGANRLSDVLPEALQAGSPVDLNAYRVQAIHGLIDHQGGRR